VTQPDPTSRYSRQPTIDVVEPDGSVKTFLAPRLVPEPQSRGAYAIRPGARLDLLGEAATGDSTRWWLLADANPWRDATRLEQSGEVIDLPDA
jgi:hypothetical protein